MHYLDNVLLFGKAESGECMQALSTALSHCATFGIPIAVHKTKGLASKLEFLGIELDANSRRLQLPEEKLHRLKVEIESWVTRWVCTMRELLSVIGQLQHACCVVKPGK